MKFNLKIILLLPLFITTLMANEISQINSSNIQKNNKIKLQLQWKHQFEFAGFYAAKEKGFFKEVGLDVEFKEFQSNMNIIDEVINGEAQYGLTYSSLIVDYMKNKPLIFVANFFKQSPLVLVTQKNIKTPADLKGKKIMGLLDSSHKQVVLTMLDKFNMTADDFQNIPRKFSIESFKNKKVDALSVFTTNEIYTLDKLGIQYNILDPAAFGTKFYDLNLFTTKSELKNNPKRIESFREASIKGWEYALKHKEELVDIILKKYNTQNKTKEALLFESKQIEYLMLTHIYPIGSIDLDRVQMIADSFAQSLLIPKESKKNLESFIYKAEKSIFLLTKEQRKYLKDKKQIKMCVDPNWMPLEKIEDGKHIGLAADIMDLVSKRIDTPIKLVPTQSWSQTLNSVKSRKCDILALAEKTPSRENYLNFTTPYIKVPLVIATKKGQLFIDNLNTIIKKPLGIVKNYSIYELLKEKYPDIKLVEVDSVKEGLEFIEQEKIFGFLDNSLVINNEIQKNDIANNIVISGQFPEISYYSIASRNDKPILGDILEKALISIDTDTKDSIINKWKNINYQTKTDYQLLLQVTFFTFVLISIFIYWNLKLKEEIKSKELAQKQLQESEEKFRTLFDIAPVLLNSFDKNGQIVLWNKECQRVFGWSKKELIVSKKPIALFYPDPKSQQKLIDSLSKPDHSSYKLWYPKTKNGETLTTMWANITLPNGDIIHIGYDITQQQKDTLLIEEKTEQLRIAKNKLEELNNSLEKKIKQEIEKNTKQQVVLMHQSKLAQMGEMIENIAHQWRQPLAQINSSVLLVDIALAKNNIDDTMIEEKLLEIESLTAYMSKTIDDFKNFFNPDKQKSIFDLEDAIEKSLDIVKGSINTHRVAVEIDIDKELKCHCYLDELQQVILTLLNNAIDALILKAIESPKIHIKAHKEDVSIFIDIQDNAGGIPENIIDKIFEPYFTTKHKTQGTGLGLYMAKMIIESGLEGTLSVENRLEGACFT
ncbi:MAG: ABC transporter substrate-binding protein, partial [Arcobacteraceae bacterium]|nr:ABC transporter substrate-binding protein [Arcobacteraceae bacterium]